MAALKVTLKKEKKDGLPTWVTVCNVCGRVNRNWAYRPAQASRRAHAQVRRHKPGGVWNWRAI